MFGRHEPLTDVVSGFESAIAVSGQLRDKQRCRVVRWLSRDRELHLPSQLEWRLPVMRPQFRPRRQPVAFRT